jgi:hypothetical protein
VGDARAAGALDAAGPGGAGDKTGNFCKAFFGFIFADMIPGRGNHGRTGMMIF